MFTADAVSGCTVEGVRDISGTEEGRFLGPLLVRSEWERSAVVLMIFRERFLFSDDRYETDGPVFVVGLMQTPVYIHSFYLYLPE